MAQPSPCVRFLLAFLAAAALLAAQTQCSVSSSPRQVRAEGVAERAGDIFLNCSFGSSPATLSGALAIYLPVAVTNPVDSSGVARDAVLLADSGGGYAATGVSGVVAGYVLSFYGINLPVPAGGRLNLKISGIRVNAAQFSGAAGQPVNAFLSFNLPLSQSQVTVAYPVASLYATLYNTGIGCWGSPLPAAISLTNLLSEGTALASTRFSEALAGAFQPRGAGDDNGTRLAVRYSGLPAGTQLFLPDFVAGSDALVPTSGGDLGLPPAVGQYVPGSGTLLLARVNLSDSSGAGGAAMPVPSGPGAVLLDSASAVPVTGGAAFAIYEVMDGNLSALESVQFPTFIGVPSASAPTVALETVSYAPVSSSPQAAVTAPVPRFAAIQPASDCGVLSDCQAGYYPRLGVQTVGDFQLSLTAGGPTRQVPGRILIGNTGSGILNWAISVNYQQGSGWLTLDTSSGQNNSSVALWVTPQNLPAGIYNANLVVSGGGPLSVPVTIPVTVTALAQPATPAPPPAPAVTVTSVVNAASLTVMPLVAGSLGTVFGSNLAGTNVAVTFDATPATLLYASATQINLVVPAGLDPSKTAALLVVTVDGVASNALTVALAPAAPAIFNGGALNQDYSPNAPASPAPAASVLQIFATGIPSGAPVSLQIGGESNLQPLYSGPAPGLAGVQQIDAALPAGLASGAQPLALCATVASRQFCSSPYTVYVK